MSQELATRSFVMIEEPRPVHPDVEKVWKERWEKLLMPNGLLDLDKVKCELHDFAFLLDQVPKVYMEITGGKLSYPNYHAETVISAANDFQNEVHEQVLADEKEAWEAEYEASHEPYHVSVREIVDSPVAIVRVITPDGKYECIWEGVTEELIPDSDPALPEDMQSHIVDAVKELLKETDDPSDLSQLPPRSI